MSEPQDALATALHATWRSRPDDDDPASMTDYAADILAALPEGAAVVTVDSLAKQLHGWGIDAESVIRDDVMEPTTQQRRAAAHIVESAKAQAAKEAERLPTGDLSSVPQGGCDAKEAESDPFDNGTGTMRREMEAYHKADLALAAAVRELEAVRAKDKRGVWSVQHDYNGRWWVEVWTDDYSGPMGSMSKTTRLSARADTLTAAIEEAIAAKEAERE